MSKVILIAFFSRSGNNYVNGSIINLPVGNTEVAAKKIKEMTGGDLLKIKSGEKIFRGLPCLHTRGAARTSRKCSAGIGRET